MRANFIFEKFKASAFLYGPMGQNYKDLEIYHRAYQFVQSVEARVPPKKDIAMGKMLRRENF